MALQTKIHTEKSKEDLIRELKVAKAQMAVLKESELRRKKAEQEVQLLQNITLAVSAANDLNTALKIILEKICTFTGWGYGQTWHIVENSKYLKCGAYYSSNEKYKKFRDISESIIAGMGFLKIVIDNKCPIWLRDEDLEDKTNFQRALVSKELGFKAALQVPILVGDEIVSIVEFLMEETRDEDARYVDIVSTIATHMGVLIKRRQVEDSLKLKEKYLEKQNLVLKDLAKNKFVRKSSLEENLKRVTEATAQTLEAERVSIWLFDDKKESIRCIDLFQKTGSNHLEGMKLFSKDYPAYFKALKEERVIDAHFAHTDSRTSEFSENYLTQYGIRSMLDAPIFVEGKLVGVVCSEHVGFPRTWTLEEKSFAGSIADYISLLLESFERKKTEEELKYSKQNLEILANSVNGVIWEASVNPSRFRFIGKNIEKILGYPVEDWLSSPTFWEDHIHPDDKERIIKLHHHSVKEMRDHEFEYRIISSSGEAVWLRDINTVVVQDGRPVAVRGVTVEITKRKESELNLQTLNVTLENKVKEGKRELLVVNEALKKEIKNRDKAELDLQLFKDLLNESKDGIFLLNPKDGSFVEVNLEACNSLGYTKEELRNKRVIEIDDVINNEEEWKKTVSWIKENGYRTFESKLLRKNGTTFPVEINVKYANHENGEYFIAIVRDITERKKAEEARNHLGLIVEHSADGIIGTSIEGIIISWNPGAEKIYGYKSEEVVGKHISMLMLSEDSEEESKTVIDLLKKGKSIERYETERVRKDGKKIYVSVDIASTKDKGGNITGISAIIRDITDSKRSEELLKEVQRKLFTLIDNIPGVVYRCKNDSDWTMEYINETCFAVTGYTREEILSKKVTYNSIIIPEDRKMVWSKVQEAVSKKEPFILEYRIETKDGKIKWIWEKGEGIFDESGKLIALEGLTNDVTERKCAEEGVHRLAAIVESSNDAIVSRTLDGVIMTWNPAAEIIYGYKAEDVIGKNVSTLIPEKYLREITPITKKIANGETIDHFETVRKRKDGTMFDVSLTLSPIYGFNNEVVGISVIARDITKRNVLKKQLESAKQKEQCEKELECLEKLVDSPDVDTVTKLFGFESLKDSLPVAFEELSNRYEDLLDLAIEENNNNADLNVTDELKFIGKQLGFLKAGPTDVLELHTLTIKNKTAKLDSELSQRYTEVGRRMALELMGYVTAYYRSHSIGTRNSIKKKS